MINGTITIKLTVENTVNYIIARYFNFTLWGIYEYDVLE
jgi:hypothetical protein